LLLNVEAALERGGPAGPALRGPPATGQHCQPRCVGEQVRGGAQHCAAVAAAGRPPFTARPRCSLGLPPPRRKWWVTLPARPSAIGPARRMNHTLTVLPPGNAVALFGGYGYPDGPGSEPVLLNDVWLLDVGRWAWSAVTTVGVPPAPRARHAATTNALLTFRGPDAAAPTPSTVAMSSIDLRPSLPPTQGTLSLGHGAALDDSGDEAPEQPTPVAAAAAAHSTATAHAGRTSPIRERQSPLRRQRPPS